MARAWEALEASLPQPERYFALSQTTALPIFNAVSLSKSPSCAGRYAFPALCPETVTHASWAFLAHASFPLERLLLCVLTIVSPSKTHLKMYRRRQDIALLFHGQLYYNLELLFISLSPSMNS